MTSRRGKKAAIPRRISTGRAARGACAARAPPKSTDPRGQAAGPCIVGIGASAGGFDAIREFLRLMPPDSGIAFIVIQHLDPHRRSLASELLGKCTSMPVAQADDGVRVMANHVYTNPPDKYVLIRRGTLHLAPVDERRDRRLPIDHFFRALGEDQHEKAIGIILSGSGADGAVGFRTIVQEGGLVIVQQPETAQFDGMPKSAINTGLVSAVLPVAEMPKVLVDYARHPYAVGTPLFAGPQGSEAAAFDQIMQALHSGHRFNFAGHKRTTVQRRILRRMGLRGIKDAAEYASVLTAEPPEADALFKDLLIGVTEFFRDPAAWEALDGEALTPLVESKMAGEPIRVWVAGAATGEEAYSLAMLLTERLEKTGKECPLQVFATDTNNDALAIARVGVYPAGIAAQLSTERLRRFFVEIADDHHYQVRKEVRESIVFGPHNLLGDPPYSKMDVVTCRNLLIYLEPEIQKKVVLLLHFALRPGGYLFLGPAETVGKHEDLFDSVSRKWRIFRRTGATPRELIELPVSSGEHRATAVDEARPAPAVPGAAGTAELVQRLIIDRFAPAAVLTNRQFDALYFCGPTDRFLAQPKGGPTRNLLSLAREGLRSRLRSAIREAEAAASSVVVSDAQVRCGDAFAPVKLTVTPIGRTGDPRGLLLVVFEDALESAPMPLDQRVAAARLVKRLEEELWATKEDLSNSIERLQVTVEELTTANEEVVSVNEELQSANEELESSKEELQSVNEELNTVNQQLQDKVGELETANSDLRNLLESNDIATLCLDREFRIKWFSPAACTLFDLVASDIGRSIKAFAPKLSDGLMIDDARKAIAKLIPVEAEVRSDAQRWYVRRTLPYRATSRRVDGVIVTFTDITEIRNKTDAEIKARTALAESLEHQVDARVRALRVELFKLAITEERERRAIAMNLHDELCQPLAAASLHLSALPGVADVASRSPPLRVLTKLVERADRAARSLMFQISPPVLFDLGLAPALEWLAEDMQRTYGLSVNVSELGNVPRAPLDETVRSVLFRCVRELLANVAKHAKVDSAEVSIFRDADRLAVSVTDTGIGFDPAVLAQRGPRERFGLVSVRERIGFVNGTLAIKAISGDGTVATLTVPLTKPGAPDAGSE